MNPLSPFTYYRRHKRQTLLLVSLVTLATLGAYTIVGVLDSFLDNAYLAFSCLTCFTSVSSSEPSVWSQIRAHPDVARVIPESSLHINVPSLAGEQTFRVLGVSEADVSVLVETCGLRLKEGRLIKARTSEIVLSENIARALDLRVGDQIGHSINKRYYGRIPTELTLVGILENDPLADSGPNVRVAFVSYEYLNSHELYGPRSPNMIVVPHKGRKAIVDNFLETTIASRQTRVWTYEKQAIQGFARGQQMLYFIFVTVDCLVAVVVALIVGVINRIALTQRLAELGLLHAIGHHKNRIVRRLTLETAAVAGVGWTAGLVISWLTFAWLKSNLYEPRGMELNLANLTPLWFTVPIPLVVIAFAALSVTRVFARLDAVAIIERGKLSMEAGDHRRAVKRSSVRPLSFRTFYLRHRRRGLTLVIATALIILGVAFPVFLISPTNDATVSLFLSYLRHASVVSTAMRRAIDPGVTAQVRTHPAVARVIPALPLSLGVSVPPAGEAGITVYAVSEQDLPILLDVYGLSLKEGSLPRARSNEIVLSESIALNRDLRVGDKVGRSGQEQDDTPSWMSGIPVEMEIVGILQSSSGQALSPGGQWMGFASYEYLESHELTSSRSVELLVVPVQGRRAELDAWLEENVASAQTNVRTYEVQYREIQQDIRDMLLMFAAVESVIALVAAISVAILNYVFFTQRREEFGILHAMGYSHPWLVLRTVRETASVVALAWLISTAVCMVGLISVQVGLFAPKGFSIDFFNPTPWLFTLPIPLAVVVASAGTIAWTLSKLDPVSIIERRS